jgi:hypothetical protein
MENILIINKYWILKILIIMNKMKIILNKNKKNLYFMNREEIVKCKKFGKKYFSFLIKK